MTARKRGRLVEMSLAYGIALLAILFFLIPPAWMLSTSLKTPLEAFQVPPSIVFIPTLDNYRAVLFGTPVEIEGMSPIEGTSVEFTGALLNSALIVATSVLIAFALGIPAAYAIVRYRFACKRDFAIFVLSTRMAPPVGVLIPFYLLFTNLKLTDTHLALIVMYVMMNLSIVVWMLPGFFREIPIELEEAARADGCSSLGVMMRIVLPLAAPGLAATAVLAIMFSWNEYLWASILTSSVARTPPVGIMAFQTYRQIEWGNMMAAGTLITLPVLVFALLAQKNLVRGLTLGAVRG